MKVRDVIQALLEADMGAEVYVTTDHKGSRVIPFHEWEYGILNDGKVTEIVEHSLGAVVLYPIKEVAK